MTMSADQARSSLAARVAERDLIRTNLQALYDNVGMRLLTGAEDPALNAAYAQAEALLVTAQCRLTAAADAVTRYQQAVRKFLGRERGP